MRSSKKNYHTPRSLSITKPAVGKSSNPQENRAPMIQATPTHTVQVEKEGLCTGIEHFKQQASFLANYPPMDHCHWSK